MTVSMLKPESRSPSEAELYSIARSLLPTLQERAAATEKARMTLPETVEEVRKLGLYDICKPKVYGGMEHHPEVLYQVSKILATACPSTAWTVCLTALHSWEVPLLDPKCAEDVWGEDPDALISSSYAPFGKVKKVEGGYEISGRWPWSSGCDPCNWVFLGGMKPVDKYDPESAPDQLAFLIPRTDYIIEDTWHVAGLCGTGSKDIVVEKAFVPEYRTHSFTEALLMKEHGRKTFNGSAYNYPFGCTFVSALVSVTLGMAIGANQCFVNSMRDKLAAYDGAKVTDDPFVRQRTANANAMIRSIDSFFKQRNSAMRKIAEAGGTFDLELRSEWKWDVVWIAKQAMEATNLVFKASGGGGIRNESPMQRFFRDIHAASNHAALNADKGSISAGGVFLGGSPTDVLI